MLVMLAGAAVAVWFGGVPIDLIVFAQGITIFIVPFIGIILFMTANSSKITGDLENGLWSRVFGIAGIVILCSLALRNAWLLFG
jgi:Mn2+/Fe2+ NRAMP family transporter